jgi:subtilisin family serine protease
MVSPLELVKLTELMERTSGNPAVKVGVIDGPIMTQHPDLGVEHLYEISGSTGAMCAQTNSMACLHGTFVTGILGAKRGCTAPGICPSCTFLIRPLFSERDVSGEQMPSTTPHELAVAILECIDAGARVINLSLAVARPSTKGEQALEEALDQAARRSVIVVAAAGNQGALGSSAITRHPWVVPVAACNPAGRPTVESNFGHSIGKRGLRAPGEKVTSLSADGGLLSLGGTSVATPFVTGAIALLWSEYPGASAAQIKLAVSQAAILRRASVVPPLLDAAAADRSLRTIKRRM